MTPTPMNAVGLVRLSDLRAEDLDDSGQGRGLVDQEARLRKHAAVLGWTIGRIIVENDLTAGNGKARNASAFKRRKVTLPDGRTELRTVRPGFRQALELLASGGADGLIALDLDRVCRDPRDLEDLIDVVEARVPRIPVESVTGSLRLANDGDVTMARIMVSVANKSSRDTARRVSAARERQALAGQYGGGRRRYGFADDGKTVVPAEAAVVADCAARLVQGVSLRALAAELRQRDVPTVTGVRWSAKTLREILLRERNVGRMVWRGEVVGVAPWAPIVVPEVHDAVVALLRGTDRLSGPGPAPRWLLSGIIRCGVCAPDVVTLTIGKANEYAVYKCRRSAHLGRAARQLDELVSGALVKWAQRDDVAGRTPVAAPIVDVKGLRAERAAIGRRLAGLAEDEVLGLRTREQVNAATRKARTRVAAIDVELAGAAVGDSPVARLVGAEDVQAAWDAMPLPERRAIVEALIVVTALPSGRRGPGFNPDTVRIEWRR